MRTAKEVAKEIWSSSGKDREKLLQEWATELLQEAANNAETTLDSGHNVVVDKESILRILEKI